MAANGASGRLRNSGPSRTYWPRTSASLAAPAPDRGRSLCFARAYFSRSGGAHDSSGSTACSCEHRRHAATSLPLRASPFHNIIDASRPRRDGLHDDFALTPMSLAVNDPFITLTARADLVRSSALRLNVPEDCFLETEAYFMASCGPNCEPLCQRHPRSHLGRFLIFFSPTVETVFSVYPPFSRLPIASPDGTHLHSRSSEAAFFGQGRGSQVSFIQFDDPLSLGLRRSRSSRGAVVGQDPVWSVLLCLHRPYLFLPEHRAVSYAAVAAPALRTSTRPLCGLRLRCERVA